MSGVSFHDVGEGEAGLRLDRWFQQHFPDLPYGHLNKLLRTGQIRVDGRRAKPNTRLEASQRIRVPPILPAPEGTARRREPAAISAEEAAALRERVLFQDDWVIALDKPAGLAVQGGTGQTRHLDRLLDALPRVGGERPRLIHRLDRDTSGVLLLARTAEAARKLGEAFKSRNTQKIYWAVVQGRPKPAEGRLELPIAKQPGGRGELMAVTLGGQPAETQYLTVSYDSARKLSWLILQPLTGRTHQLRVHMAALGTPILGDGKYGQVSKGPDGGRLRLHLHAREIALPHPADGTTLRVTAPLPEHMAPTFEASGFQQSRGDNLALRLGEGPLKRVPLEPAE